MKLLVLAGGYGTRLYPLIKDTPKALLKVAHETLIDHTLNKFKDIPFIEEVCVVTNEKFYLQLLQWAETRKDFPLIKVLNDGTTTPENRLGAMGDILFVLKQEQKTSDWIVVGSDNLFDQDISSFIDAVNQRPKNVSVGAFDVERLEKASQYGVIHMDKDHKVLMLEEKPQHPTSTLISMCLYYFTKESLILMTEFIKETNKTDTTGGYIQWLCKRIDVYGVKFFGKWYDIGSVESFHEAQQYFFKKSL